MDWTKRPTPADVPTKEPDMTTENATEATSPDTTPIDTTDAVPETTPGNLVDTLEETVTDVMTSTAQTVESAVETTPDPALPPNQQVKDLLDQAAQTALDTLGAHVAGLLTPTEKAAAMALAPTAIAKIYQLEHAMTAKLSAPPTPGSQAGAVADKIGRAVIGVVCQSPLIGALAADGLDWLIGIGEDIATELNKPAIVDNTAQLTHVDPSQAPNPDEVLP